MVGVRARCLLFAICYLLFVVCYMCLIVVRRFLFVD